MLLPVQSTGVVHGLTILIKPAASGNYSATGQFNLDVPDVLLIVVDSLLFFRLGVHSKRIRIVCNSHCLDWNIPAECSTGTVRGWCNADEHDATAATTCRSHCCHDNNACGTGNLLRGRVPRDEQPSPKEKRRGHRECDRDQVFHRWVQCEI